MSSQGLTGHDAVDQITETRGERHQHYHSWLCGARRIHQRRHHPQLSPGRRRRWRHLRAHRGRQGAQSPRPVVWSVLSLFSLWHLFQEGSCTAPFTLFRAIVSWENQVAKMGVERREVVIGRNNTGVWLEHKENEVLFISYLGDRSCFLSSEMFVFFTSCAVKLIAFSTEQMHRFQAYHFPKGRFLRAYQLSAKCIHTSSLVF